MSKHLFRVTLFLAAAFSAATVTPLRAQQTPDTPRVVMLENTWSTHSPSTMQRGPRLAPPLTSFTPTLARSNTSAGSSLAASGGDHTIVVSTLALVLGVIVLVLLIVR